MSRGVSQHNTHLVSGEYCVDCDLVQGAPALLSTVKLALMDTQEVRALSLLDGLATLTLAGNPLLERLGPRAVDVLVRNACPAVVSLDGRELSGGQRGPRKAAAAATSAEVHTCCHTGCFAY